MRKRSRSRILRACFGGSRTTSSSSSSGGVHSTSIYSTGKTSRRAPTFDAVAVSEVRPTFATRYATIADALAALGAMPSNGLDGVVIGGMSVASITTTRSAVVVAVVFTSNLAERDRAGSPAAVYMEEKWLLSRDANARSRSPERARVIGCPSCGAPLEKTARSAATAA